MAILTEADVLAAAHSKTMYKAASSILRESRDSSLSSFDIFLSHAKLDTEIVVGVKAILEATGQSVYVDWINDPQLDRSAVTPKTANLIRSRMRQCKSLMYVYTPNATNSRWMPWELGYFDAYNGNVAILPVLKAGQTFKGEEFLGLYPYVDLTGRSVVNPGTLYIHRNPNQYTKFGDWRTPTSDKMRPSL
jgi:hypothetical protein